MLKDLFGAESLKSVAPLLANAEALPKALALIEDRAARAGAVLEEFGRQSGTAAAARQNIANTLDRLVIVIGTQFLPAMQDAIATIRPIIDGVTAWARANPELVKGIGLAAAGLVGLNLAFAAGKLLFFSSTLGLLKFGSTAMTVLGAGGTVAKAALALLGPAGIIAVGVIAAGAVIYDNWDRITGYFGEKIEAIRAAFDVGLINGVMATMSALNPFALAIDGIVGLIEYLTGFDLMEYFPAIEWLKVFGNPIELLRRLFNFKWSSILPSFNWSEIIPARPSWLGGERGSQPKSNYVNPVDEFSGMRDAGGPVVAGGVYRVAERFGEIFDTAAGRMFIPHVSGRIQPMQPVRAGRGGGSRSVQIGDIHIHAQPGQDARAIAAEVRRQLGAMMRRDGDLHDGALV